MINVIADRYAQALFEVGEETQTTSELYQELSELVDIFNENKDLYNFLKSPLIGREDKKNVMNNIFEKLLRPHGLWPARLLCPWNSPGKNTGMGCHFLLQGIFLT